MKKITLALFAAVSVFSSAFGQAIITPTIPLVNSSTQLRLPQGTITERSLKGNMLIKASEMTALTGSLVNSMGVILLDGTDPVQASGNFSVYVEETNDVTNTKIAGGYAAAKATATLVYNGPITIPTVAATVIFTLNCTPQLTITPGKGVYITYQYEQTSVTTNTYPATWACNNAGTGNGLCATSASNTVNGAPDALTVTDFRPSWIFRAVNTATNEVGVMEAFVMGKYAKLSAAGSTVQAIIQNNSVGPLSNISVSLTAPAPNAFSNVQVIPALTAGQATVINFAAFTPTANGLVNLSVTINADQILTNNQIVLQQSVTCNEVAIHPPVVAGSYTSQGYGAGASTSGLIYSFKYSATANGSLTSVKLVIPGFSNAMNSGKQLFAVLLDATGNILAQGNPATISGAQLDVFSTWGFPAGQPTGITAGQDYFFGIAMPANGYFPVGNMGFTSTPIAGYFSHAIAGGNATPINVGHLSLEGVLAFDNYQITASTTKTTVCKGGNETVTLTASGADSYTWAPAISGGASTFTWVPTVAGAGTATQVVVTGGYTTPVAFGCKSNSVAITYSLLNCTGINESAAAANIKLFPNPAVSGKSTISGLDGVNTITVFNTLGQAVIKETVSIETYTLDMTNIPAGNYLVKITNSANESKTIKFVNQN